MGLFCCKPVFFCVCDVSLLSLRVSVEYPPVYDERDLNVALKAGEGNDC